MNTEETHLCECGCSKPTRRAAQTDARRGISQGDFRRFLPGHGRRVDPASRFWPRVDKSGTCWFWVGPTDDDGYGLFWWPEMHTRHAHRAAWILTNGPISDGLHVCHNCPGGDNPACCNPNHLYLGTPAINVHDTVTKGRISRGEDRWNAKLTRAQVDEIRARYTGTRGEITQLAEEYPVSKSMIRRIIRNKAWKHIL